MLEQQRIVFVGGKGGVGKTTTAAALALQWARRGERCLLVSTDPAHSLGDLFGCQLGEREYPLADGLWGLEIDPEGEADRYVAGVSRTLRTLMPPHLYGEIDRQMRMTRQAPGALEAALLERVADVMEAASEGYDRVVFDTAPTGHTMRLLSLPEVMGAWVDGMLQQRERSGRLGRMLAQLGGKGSDLTYFDDPDALPDSREGRITSVLLARRRKFHRARRLLLDADRCAFVLVLTPEKLPILESAKALDTLARFRVPVAGLVVNRVLPAEAEGPFWATRRAQERVYLGEIATRFANWPQLHVPLFARDIEGVAGLEQVAAHLTLAP
ncbi:ArsA family ATPase [Truepera radiovictrix]|uniref:Arsenite-activated ATPase ArsA n=1 Tax=Truepera radiovictrix (strain DSM 17093 / CIP 108686 / LMG 22925 / RQ-24) TaxID=649638 RepID=D7CVB5_TRURR|nr:ArsA family ATPase [Truepera radiovictrix]ADI14143.1 arsenite-activated ATPase ArsA [Truepera radiovictrix DSM 17093]WMT57295.1 ArsA family ATPase [Truepera radiovictrix]